MPAGVKRNPEEHVLASCLAAAAASLIAMVTIAAPFTVVNYSELNWVPKDALPHGAVGATVRGDPRVGPYAFLGRFPEKFTVPMHWHTNDVAVLMTEGSMTIRTANETKRIDQGGYFFLPGSMRYVAECEHACTFLAWGEKPFDIYYLEPNDDPRLHMK